MQIARVPFSSILNTNLVSRCCLRSISHKNGDVFHHLFNRAKAHLVRSADNG